jgi:MSHA biogenesis protein MshN
MSLINQVLNELEQRGAHTATDQPMVRAVINAKRNSRMPLLVVGLILAAGIVIWLWMHNSKNPLDDVPTARNSSNSIEFDDSFFQQQLVAATVAQTGDVAVEKSSIKRSAPALRLTLELSSPPLHSVTQQDSEQASRQDKLKTMNTGVRVVEDKADVLPPPVLSSAGKVNETSAGQSAVSTIPVKQISSMQQADAEFRRAAGLMQQGRIVDAIAGYEVALRLDAGHAAARQALVALLLESKRNAEAEKVLQEGLNNNPANSGHTMLLARLQVERGALDQASAILEKSLSFAGNQPDYRAFLAALLQRQNRHEEAIKNYQFVVQAAPNNGVWLMGYGISLQAVQRNGEAQDVFQRALDTKTLSPELQTFVQHKLKAF